MCVNSGSKLDSVRNLFATLAVLGMCIPQLTLGAEPHMPTNSLPNYELAVPSLAEDVGGRRGEVLPPPPPSDDDAGVCSVYTFGFRMQRENPLLDEIFQLTETGKQLGCLEKVLKESTDQCSRLRQIAGERDYDDCIIAGYFLSAGAFGRSLANHTTWTPVKTYGCYSASATPEQLMASANKESTGQNCQMVYGADYLFDSSCNPVDTIPEELAECDTGRAVWRVSPISLLVDGSSELDGNATAVKFPLDPRKSDKWYLWYASSKAPLLVYDPSHTGKINSAFQLFGNWTLGGKQLASAAALRTPNALASEQTAWENGFEALGSFDANADGAIAGPELSSLALWFDDNRNAVAEPGEVRSLAQEGITKLFYSVSSTDASGNIYSIRGFERSRNGQSEFGTSVDWYAVEGSSQYDLLSKLLTLRSLGASEAVAPATGAFNATESQSEKQQNSKVLGLWRWKSNDAEVADGSGRAPEGYLQFRGVRESAVFGYTLSESEFRQGYRLKSSVAVRPFSGSLVTAGSDQAVEFTVREQDGSSVSSKAHLSSSGDELLGTTVAKVRNGSGWVSIQYSWTATRG